MRSITERAGTAILSHRDLLESSTLKSPNEIVTPADEHANSIIIEMLLEAYPDIPIYSEESIEHSSEHSTRWIVDPLDGTTPWVWGNSGFSISIALEKDGEIVVGAVYDPIMKEFFYAEKGGGAYRNDSSISVKPVPQNDMFMVVDWGNAENKRAEGLEYYKKLLVPEMFAKRIVPQFAPALGLCRIAEGRIHALVCNDTWTEDHAAGSLILTEAGGVVANFYDTDTFSHRRACIVATTDLDSLQAIKGALSKL